MSEVAGVQLAELEEPIRAALSIYSGISEGSVEFDLDTACKLELTPDKPNSARSVSSVKYLGEMASTLYVIAFSPQDGTGDENTYKLAEIDTRQYPDTTKVLPRSKATTLSEAHLTILSKRLERPLEDPMLFAGNLDLITTGGNWLEKAGEIGQSIESYMDAIQSVADSYPTSTLTVGYTQAIGSTEAAPMWDYWRLRFGDPHAVYNPHQELQLCGFIGIPAEDRTVFNDLDPLRALKSVEPRLT